MPKNTTQFDILLEEDVNADIQKIMLNAQKYLPNYFNINKTERIKLPDSVLAKFLSKNKLEKLDSALKSSNLTPEISNLIFRSYEAAYDSGLLTEYLKSLNKPQSLVILEKPLLGDEWQQVDSQSRKAVQSDAYLIFGACDKLKKYPMISMYGLGSSEIAICRASKILAHEIVHSIKNLEDRSCSDKECIMYNHRYTEPPIERTKETLEFLDKKSGWCDFHKTILFPERH